MPAIQIKQALLALAGNSQLAMERNSPLLSEPGESGSTSQAFRLPRTDANSRALGYPARFDQRAGGPPEHLDVEAIDDAGNGITTGTLRFRGLDPDAYLYNLEFGDSAVMTRLKAKRLQGFRFGGPRTIELPAPAEPINPFDSMALARYMRHVVDNEKEYDFVFAPFSNNDHNGKWESFVKSTQDFWDYLRIPNNFIGTHTQNFNTWSTYLATPGLTGGEFSYATEPFSVPGLPGFISPVAPLDTCQLCPLPKLEYVVRTMFREMQLELETDVFDEPEMQQLVLVPVAGVVGLVAAPGGIDFTGTLHISQHVPDLSAAEFLRKLMDTFGWHFDAQGSAHCRLLRAAPLVLTGNPVEIDTLVGTAYTIEPQDEVSIIVQPNIAEADAYAQEYSEQPDPATILAPVPTVADLPTLTTIGIHVLVQELRRYYYTESVTTTTGTSKEDRTSTTVIEWIPGPFYLPGQQVGAAEDSQDYTPGAAAVLTCQVQLGFDATTKVDVLCFLEPSYTTSTVELTTAATSSAGAYTITTTSTKSATLRLGFYRGLLPITGAADNRGNVATVPWLTQRNVDPRGKVIGKYSLEVHGKFGLANTQLLPLIALKSAKTIVKFPALFTPRQFTQLDMSRMVSIQGNEFMVRRLSITLPANQPGTLEAIPRRQVASVTSRPVVSDGFYTSTGVPALTCTLLVPTVAKNGDVATVSTDAAHGKLRYQLDAGDLQDSNVFTGLIEGQTYTFWVYDMGVTGCNRSTTLVW